MNGAAFAGWPRRHRGVALADVVHTGAVGTDLGIGDPAVSPLGFGAVVGPTWMSLISTRSGYVGQDMGMLGETESESD